LEAEAAREQHPKAEMVPTGTPLPDFTRLDPEVLAFIANLGQAAAAASQDALAQRKRIAELTPGYELAETFAAANGTMTVRTFARNVQQWAQPRGIKVLQQHVFDYLGMIGMIIRSGTSEKGQPPPTPSRRAGGGSATPASAPGRRGPRLTASAPPP